MNSITNVQKKNKFNFFIFILFLGIAFQIFFGLSEPRLWNDEAETAVYGSRILKYGFPKIHDEKNILFLLCPWIEKGSIIGKDAYLGSVWGQYYYGAIGAGISNYFNNDGAKTFSIRFPFSLLGYVSILVYLGILLLFYNKKNSSLIICYLLLVFFHTHFLLHLREARYYSLILLGQGCLFYLWYRKQLLPNKTSIKKFNILFPFINFLNFNLFYPAAIITFCYFSLNLFISILKNKCPKKIIRETIPFFITAIMFVFLLKFYKIFQIQQTLAQIFTGSSYIRNLEKIFICLIEIDYMYLYLSGLIASFLLFVTKKDKTKCMQIMHSLNISGYIFFYILIASFSKVFFARYLIVLHPLIIICIIIQWSFIVSEIEKKLQRRTSIKILKISIISFIIVTHSHLILNSYEHIKSFFSSYKGPVDVAIEFIRLKFKNPENITIATNVEEPCYMFYLNSKVIVGLTKPNIENDMKDIPDVILFRKQHDYVFGEMSSKTHSEIFTELLKKDKYLDYSFPIIDTQFNNFPSLFGYNRHRFKTAITDDIQKKVIISLKASTLKKDKNNRGK